MDWIAATAVANRKSDGLDSIHNNKPEVVDWIADTHSCKPEDRWTGYSKRMTATKSPMDQSQATATLKFSGEPAKKRKIRLT